MPPTLTSADLTRAAMSRRIEPAALRAVLAVESSGSGFLPDGRPKILLERHWVWKQLLSRGINPRPFAASRPDLCGERWERKYYLGGAGEYARLEAVVDWASAHDSSRWESFKKSALEACSWGLPQVMGIHFKRVGFENVYEFKHHVERGEAEQLEVMMRFLETGGLLDELRDKRWASFARSYNGGGQVPIYAARLAAAYWSAKRREGSSAPR